MLDFVAIDTCFLGLYFIVCFSAVRKRMGFLGVQPISGDCKELSLIHIYKPFEKAFMDTMKLFMAIPDRINFLQLGRYGCFSEQTYRNLFEHETFDWFAFNGSIISKHLTGKRKAIAIAPSYIPKSGHKTPWIGYFRSGCAGDYKRGLRNHGHRCH